MSIKQLNARHELYGEN